MKQGEKEESGELIGGEGRGKRNGREKMKRKEGGRRRERCSTDYIGG